MSASLGMNSLKQATQHTHACTHTHVVIPIQHICKMNTVPNSGYTWFQAHGKLGRCPAFPQPNPKNCDFPLCNVNPSETFISQRTFQQPQSCRLQCLPTHHHSRLNCVLSHTAPTHSLRPAPHATVGHARTSSPTSVWNTIGPHPLGQSHPCKCYCCQLVQALGVLPHLPLCCPMKSEADCSSLLASPFAFFSWPSSSSLACCCGLWLLVLYTQPTSYYRISTEWCLLLQ